MEAATRRILKAIENELITGKRAGKELWSIFTALRGPDNLKYQLKAAYTEVIRAHAFPRVATSMYAPAAFSIDSKTRKQYRDKIGRSHLHKHFISHAVWAFTALGLELESVNHLQRNKKKKSVRPRSKKKVV